MGTEPPEFEQEESELQPSVKIDLDMPIEEVKASLKRALQEAKSGQRISISQMWESIDLQSQDDG
jgi:hypothetical protein